MIENTPLISVIVPVYNVEKYLARCIDSIIAQTYKNLEIILVDDGSADTSGAICDEYAHTDSRIRVFHKENGGLSDARNFGIAESHGEYLGFVDSDDYIATDMYELLYSLVCEYNVSMAACDVCDVDDGKEPHLISKGDGILCVGREEAMRIVLDGRINYAYAWNKLYKRELFDTIRYPVGKYIEDFFVILPLIEKAGNVAFCPEQKYYYVHRENSIMTSVFSKKHYDCIEVHEQNYRFICDKYPALEKNARMRLYWSRFFVLDKMLMSGTVTKDEYMPLVKYIRGGVPFIVFESILSRSRKLASIVLLFSVRAYKALLCRK